MKDYFNSLLVAFSMFSSLPVPQKCVRWDEKGMKYMMAAFPVVGIVIGAIIFFWVYLAGWFNLPNVLRALGLTLIPIALTGGIHLDGLADTCDALKSNATPERRREILKDPRAGAFAVIGIGVYLIAYFGLVTVFDRSMPNVLLLCIGFVFSRTLSGLSVVLLPSVRDGTAKMFRDASTNRSVLILWTTGLLCVVAAAVVVFFNAHIVSGFWLWLIASGLCLIYLVYTSKRKFAGMSGDLAGWFLQLCEIFQLAAIVLAPYIFSIGGKP